MSNLQKNMSVPQGVVLAICTLIGSGLLGLPGLAVEEGGLTASILGWMVSILISLPLVLVFYDLSLKSQSAGGIATYAGYAFGKWAEKGVAYVLVASFLFGMPVGTYMSALFLQDIFGIADGYIMFILFGLMGCMTITNYFGLKPAGWLNGVSVASLLVFIGFILLTNWQYFPDGLAENITALQHIGDLFNNDVNGDVNSDSNAEGAVSFSSLWVVCSILFWAFIGWENMSFSSEEIKGEANSDGTHSNEKSIKQIYFWAFVLVSLIYLSLAVLTAGAVVNGESVSGVTGILTLLDGTPVEKVAHALIVFVILANGNSWVYACSRLLYSSGKEGILPSYLAKLSNNKGGEGIPRASILTLFAMFSVMSVMIYFEWVPLARGISMISQNFIVVYILSIVCFLKMNRHSVYAWVVGLFALSSCGFLLAGFGWFVLIPMTILGLGWIVERVQARAKGNT